MSVSCCLVIFSAPLLHDINVMHFWIQINSNNRLLIPYDQKRLLLMFFACSETDFSGKLAFHSCFCLIKQSSASVVLNRFYPCASCGFLPYGQH